MTVFVRVRDNVTGHEYSVSKRYAEANQGKDFSIVEKDALDANGRPAPAKTKPRELTAKSAPIKTGGESK